MARAVLQGQLKLLLPLKASLHTRIQFDFEMLREPLVNLGPYVQNQQVKTDGPPKGALLS
jgi:hypothetical protein